MKLTMNHNSEGFNLYLNPGEQRERSARRLYANLKRLNPEMRWTVEAKPASNKRSENQNNYLWGVVYPIIEQATGHRKEYWHEYFLEGHFGTVESEFVNPTTGEVKTIQRPRVRSSKLPVKEFAGFIDYVIETCAEYGLTIPDPDPNIL